jgi:hypothetical protein
VHRFLLSSPCPVVLVVSEVDARDEHCVDQYVPTSIRQRYVLNFLSYSSTALLVMSSALFAAASDL